MKRKTTKKEEKPPYNLFLLLSSSFGIYENNGDLESEIEYERK